MTPRPARLPRVLAASAFALVVPLAACAGTDASEDAGAASESSSSAPAPSGAGATQSPEAAPPEAATRIEVQVTAGQVAGDTGRVPVTLGEQVTLAITSDAADEAHVHGYDLSADLVPGTPAEISFTASVPGVFEVELHEAGTVLLTLQVS